MSARRAKRWQVLEVDQWGFARLRSIFVVRGRTRHEAIKAMRKHPALCIKRTSPRAER